MMPIVPLMIEHRVIERMIVALRAELSAIEQTGSLDVGFLASAVDFLRRYADQCHHGKEELILFRELQRKALQPQHAATLAELLDEHTAGRAAVGRLATAIGGHRPGDATSEVIERLRAIVEFYPAHIRKEDHGFFRPVMDLFTQEERDGMLAEGHALDSSLLHEWYLPVVGAAEARHKPK
jgi:hemerythrin-like domain-containing protein